MILLQYYSLHFLSISDQCISHQQIHFSSFNKINSQFYSLFLSSLVVSFNQPRFCATASWNTNGITFANQSVVGSRPYAVFVNTNNSIFVANRENSTVLVWHENTIKPTKIIVGNFRSPFAVFVTSNGDIWIDDGGYNRQVQRWRANTNTFDIVMYGNAPCLGLFVDTNDTLYCSMRDLHQVVKRWLNDSEITSIFVPAAGTAYPGAEFNELNEPVGIFVDVNFDLYVADFRNDRVQLFPSGELNGITVAGSKSPNPTIDLILPSQIVLDAEKHLFIADMGTNRIVGSSVNGFRCLVGCYGMGVKSSRLNEPSSLSFDRFGNVFVVDHINHRLQKFEYVEKSCGERS